MLRYVNLPFSGIVLLLSSSNNSKQNAFSVALNRSAPICTRATDFSGSLVCICGYFRCSPLTPRPKVPVTDCALAQVIDGAPLPVCGTQGELDEDLEVGVFRIVKVKPRNRNNPRGAAVINMQNGVPARPKLKHRLGQNANGNFWFDSVKRDEVARQQSFSGPQSQLGPQVSRSPLILGLNTQDPTAEEHAQAQKRQDWKASVQRQEEQIAQYYISGSTAANLPSFHHHLGQPGQNNCAQELIMPINPVYETTDLSEYLSEYDPHLYSQIFGPHPPVTADSNAAGFGTNPNNESTLGYGEDNLDPYGQTGAISNNTQFIGKGEYYPNGQIGQDEIIPQPNHSGTIDMSYSFEAFYTTVKNNQYFLGNAEYIPNSQIGQDMVVSQPNDYEPINAIYSPTSFTTTLSNDKSFLGNDKLNTHTKMDPQMLAVHTPQPTHPPSAFLNISPGFNPSTPFLDTTFHGVPEHIPGPINNNNRIPSPPVTPPSWNDAPRVKRMKLSNNCQTTENAVPFTFTPTPPNTPEDTAKQIPTGTSGKSRKLKFGYTGLEKTMGKRVRED